MKVCKCLATSSVKLCFSCSVRLYQPYVFFPTNSEQRKHFCANSQWKKLKPTLTKWTFEAPRTIVH